MSFHPEEQKGWSEGSACPYCGGMRFDCLDDGKTEYGVAAVFLVTECECECGKRFKLVEVIETTPYGTYKGVEE